MSRASRRTPTTDRVTRYVVTHIDRDGMRRLFGPAQGRFTHETAEEAQAHIDAIINNNGAQTLHDVYGPQDLKLEVRPCECWPGHFDPVGIYFDE